jgi:hypothetical protein
MILKKIKNEKSYRVIDVKNTKNIFSHFLLFQEPFGALPLGIHYKINKKNNNV